MVWVLVIAEGGRFLKVKVFDSKHLAASFIKFFKEDKNNEGGNFKFKLYQEDVLFFDSWN